MERMKISVGTRNTPAPRANVEEVFGDNGAGGNCVEWKGELGGYVLDLEATAVNEALTLTVRVDGEKRLLIVGKVAAPSTFEVGLSSSDCLNIQLA